MLRRQATAEPEIRRAASPSLTPAGKHNTSICYHIESVLISAPNSAAYEVFVCFQTERLVTDVMNHNDSAVKYFLIYKCHKKNINNCYKLCLMTGYESDLGHHR